MTPLTPTAPRQQVKKLNLGQLPARDLDRVGTIIDDYAERHDVPSIIRPSDTKALQTQPAAAEGDTSNNVTPMRKPRAVKKERAVNIRVAVDLPDYVVKAIAKTAVNEEVTKRFLFLKALRSIGITVNDVDMEEDGRRAK
jgi:hypothetical protein